MGCLCYCLVHNPLLTMCFPYRLFLSFVLFHFIQSSSMATVFSGQAIHVDDKGNLALVGVEVEDDDPNFNNGGAFEAGDTPEGEIGGKEFSPNAEDPDVTMSIVNVDITDNLGTVSGVLVLRYEIKDQTYYLIGNGLQVNADKIIGIVFNSDTGNSIQSIPYSGYGLYETLPNPSAGPTRTQYSGVAFRLNRQGKAQGVSVQVWDDDSNMNNVGGGASEQNAFPPVGRIGGINFTPNADHNQTDLDIHTVKVTDDLGVLNNVLAVRYLVNGITFYVISNGTGIDVGSVSVISFLSDTGNSVSAIPYSGYGMYETLPNPAPGASMTSYQGAAFRVNRAGSVTPVDVEVWDDDRNMNNVGGGASEQNALPPVGRIGGINFTPNADHRQTDLDIHTVMVTDGLGVLNNVLAVRYLVNGITFYVISNGTGIDVGSVSVISFLSDTGNSVSAIPYSGYGMYETLPNPAPGASMTSYLGAAFRVNRAGSVTPVDVEVWDDDRNMNNVGGGASEQNALPPVGRIGGIYFTPNADHNQTDLDIHTVMVTDGLGVLNNVLAVRYLVDGFTFYVISNGTGIDVGSVSAISFVSDTGNSVSAIPYSGYGMYETLPTPVVEASMSHYKGKALRRNRVGDAALVDVDIWDDDSSYTDVDSGATEGGTFDPVGTIDGIHFSPNAAHQQTDLRVVTLAFTDSLGSESGVLAFEYKVNGFFYYLLRSDFGAELGSVSSISSVADQGTGISSIPYQGYHIFGVSPLGQSGMTATGNALKVDRDGGLSVESMQLWDDDTFFSNVGEGDTEQLLDPYGLIASTCYFSPNGSDPGTVVRTVELEIVNLAANTRKVRAIEYVVGGIAYYIPRPAGNWFAENVKEFNGVDAVDDPPVITSGGAASVTENVSVSTAIYKAIATDFEGEQLVFSISGGTDAGFFSINAETGNLFFKSPPDFENPGDGNGNNVYRVVVSASDGNSSDDKLVLITVTDDPNEDPYPAWIASFFPGENDPQIVGRGADPDGDGLSNEFELVYDSDPSIGVEPSKAPIVSVRVLTGAEIEAIDAGASVTLSKRYYVVKVRRPKVLLPGVSFQVRSGHDLEDLGGSPTSFGTSVDDGNYWIQDYYLTPSVTDVEKGFCRVVLSFP